MRITMIKNERIYIGAILFLFILHSCNDTKRTETYISEALINREIYSGFHGDSCKGFHEQQFDHCKIFVKNIYQKLLKKQTSLNWEKFSNSNDFINFAEMYNDSNGVIHLIDIIESKSNCEKILSIGSDDGVQVWLNGDSLFSNHNYWGRAVKKHDDLIKIKLKKGKNILLYKVDQGGGAWGLYRHILDENEIENVITGYGGRLWDIFRDIPESCIIDDTCNFITVKEKILSKQNNLKNICRLPGIKIEWLDFDNEIISSKVYREIPVKFFLPQNHEEKLLLRVSVLNKDQSIRIRETIPILQRSSANRLAKELAKYSNQDIITKVRQEAVKSVFHLTNDTITLKTEYSTRMKAHILYDLYRSVHNLKEIFPGPNIMGYKLNDTPEMYRAFIPKECSNDNVSFTFFVPFIRQQDREFLQISPGKSHFYMARWSKLSSEYNTIIVTPHGGGGENFIGDTKGELDSIYKNVSEDIKFDKSNINLYTVSNGAVSALFLLTETKLKFKHVAFFSPDIDFNNAELEKILKLIKRKNPKIKIYIWHGTKDEKAPVERTRKQVKIFKKYFTVQYTEIENGTHSFYMEAMGSRFFKEIYIK